MLDTLTGGRVIAGMLRGTTNEYVTYGGQSGRVPRALRRGPRPHCPCVDGAPAISAGRDGYYEYRAISIWPRPVQQPHPPIYISGSSPEAGELAARAHLRLGFAFTTVPLAA